MRKIIQHSNLSEVETVLKKVYDDGLNIYALINRLKRARKWKVDQNLPDDIILGVCSQYFKDKGSIKRPWPWFIKVVNMECDQWFARENIRQNEESKKQGMPQVMKDIFKDIFKNIARQC